MSLITLSGEEKDAHLSALIESTRFAEKIKGIESHGQIPQIRSFLQLVKAHPIVKVSDMNSGFPHIEALTEVKLEKRYAHEFLQNLPPIEALVETCIRQLHTDKTDFSVISEKASKIAFYTQMQEANLPEIEECRVLEYIEAKKRGEFDEYQILYGGFDLAKMRFQSYSHHLYQKKD